MVFISAKYFLIARMLVILLCTNMLIMKAPIIQPKINRRSKEFFGNEATLLTSKILKMSKYSFWISTTLPTSFFMPTINSRKTEKLKSIKIHNSIEHIFVTEIYILTILSKIGIKKTILFRIVSLLSKIFVHMDTSPHDLRYEVSSNLFLSHDNFCFRDAQTLCYKN